MMEKRAVIAIVKKGDKVLMGKKRSDSSKFMAGKWHLIAENVEKEETDEQALIRGVLEETSINIKVGKFLDNYVTRTGKFARFYECFYLAGEICIGSDLEDAEWVDRKSVLTRCEERDYLWSKKIQDYFRG